MPWRLSPKGLIVVLWKSPWFSKCHILFSTSPFAVFFPTWRALSQLFFSESWFEWLQCNLIIAFAVHPCRYLYFCTITVKRTQFFTRTTKFLVNSCHNLFISNAWCLAHLFVFKYWYFSRSYPCSPLSYS